MLTDVGHDINEKFEDAEEYIAEENAKAISVSCVTMCNIIGCADCEAATRMNINIQPTEKEFQSNSTIELYSEVCYFDV